MALRKSPTLDHDLQPIALPAAFFTRLLPAIDDLAELKVTLFALASLQQKEGEYRFLRLDEFLADAGLMRGLAIIDDAASASETLERALRLSLDRQTLLLAEATVANETARYYTAADEKGRALQRRILTGDWRPAAAGEIELLPARPSIYALYEANIGLLTPMIAESIKAAESDYPPGWIEEAMRLAVEANKRSWSYIRAILDRWGQEGRGSEKRGRHTRRRKPNRAR